MAEVAVSAQHVESIHRAIAAKYHTADSVEALKDEYYGETDSIVGTHQYDYLTYDPSQTEWYTDDLAGIHAHMEAQIGRMQVAEALTRQINDNSEVSRKSSLATGLSGTVKMSQAVDELMQSGRATEFDLLLGITPRFVVARRFYGGATLGNCIRTLRSTAREARNRQWQSIDMESSQFIKLVADEVLIGVAGLAVLTNSKTIAHQAVNGPSLKPVADKASQLLLERQQPPHAA